MPDTADQAAEPSAATPRVPQPNMHQGVTGHVSAEAAQAAALARFHEITRQLIGGPRFEGGWRNVDALAQYPH